MLKYSVTDETGAFEYLKTDNLKEAIDKARSMYFDGYKKHGVIEFFTVLNNFTGTLAFVIPEIR